MDALPPELFIFAVVAFLVGAASMWLINYAGRGGRAKQTQQSAAQPEGLSPVGGRELLRVLRSRGGQPDILVQGQRYHHLREIADPQVGRETIEALAAVLAFAEEWLPLIQQQQSAQPGPTPTASDQEALLQQLRQPPRPSADKPPTPLPGKPEVREPGRMLDPLTMVDDIDEILQRKLQDRPDLAARFIRLTTGPSGGLRIYVDRQTFDAVGDIPDQEVRAFIQDAIREWESR